MGQVNEGSKAKCKLNPHSVFCAIWTYDLEVSGQVLQQFSHRVASVFSMEMDPFPAQSKIKKTKLYHCLKYLFNSLLQKRTAQQYSLELTVKQDF